MIREGFENPSPGCLRTPLEYRQRAAEVYRLYSTATFALQVLSASLFNAQLAKDLAEDAGAAASRSSPGAAIGIGLRYQAGGIARSDHSQA